MYVGNNVYVVYNNVTCILVMLLHFDISIPSYHLFLSTF